MSDAGREWFDGPDGEGQPGLRFSCTMCGNCCTGAEGYVLVSDAEALALSRRLGVGLEEFLARYTHMTPPGRSLTEKLSDRGHDCVFLERDGVSGRAVCVVYEDRPAQCRTWPFWKSLVSSRHAWERASRRCPGMGRGARYTPAQVRVLRDKVDI